MVDFCGPETDVRPEYALQIPASTKDRYLPLRIGKPSRSWPRRSDKHSFLYQGRKYDCPTDDLEAIPILTGRHPASHLMAAVQTNPWQAHYTETFAELNSDCRTAPDALAFFQLLDGKHPNGT